MWKYDANFRAWEYADNTYLRKWYYTHEIPLDSGGSIVRNSDRALFTKDCLEPSLATTVAAIVADIAHKPPSPPTIHDDDDDGATSHDDDDNDNDDDSAASHDEIDEKTVDAVFDATLRVLHEDVIVAATWNNILENWRRKFSGTVQCIARASLFTASQLEESLENVRGRIQSADYIQRAQIRICMLKPCIGTSLLQKMHVNLPADTIIIFVDWTLKTQSTRLLPRPPSPEQRQWQALVMRKKKGD
jgi:hypothetical protein